jgi:hypothetical protein
LSTKSVDFKVETLVETKGICPVCENVSVVAIDWLPSAVAEDKIEPSLKII